MENTRTKEEEKNNNIAVTKCPKSITSDSRLTAARVTLSEIPHERVNAASLASMNESRSSAADHGVKHSLAARALRSFPFAECFRLSVGSAFMQLSFAHTLAREWRRARVCVSSEKSMKLAILSKLSNSDACVFFSFIFSR